MRVSSYFTSAAAAVAITIAATAGIGWLTGLDPLTSVVPGWATLKPNTAVCIGLLGAALVVPPRWRPWLAAVPALLTALTGVEWVAGIDLGIDEMLASDPASASVGEPPGRMAAATALGLFAVAGAVASANSLPSLSQACAACAVAVAWIAMLGYAYELGPLWSVWLYGSV